MKTSCFGSHYPPFFEPKSVFYLRNSKESFVSTTGPENMKRRNVADGKRRPVKRTKISDNFFGRWEVLLKITIWLSEEGCLVKILQSLLNVIKIDRLAAIQELTLYKCLNLYYYSILHITEGVLLCNVGPYLLALKRYFTKCGFSKPKERKNIKYSTKSYARFAKICFLNMKLKTVIPSKYGIHI